MAKASYVKPLPSVDRLHRGLDYSPKTGLFCWKDGAKGGVSSGDIAGTLRPNGYIYIRIDKEHYLAHRLAWLYVTGDDPASLEVDHVNGERIDNRIKNLRLASRNEQCHNTGIRSDNTSGVRGVSWDRQYGKWLGRIQINGQTFRLGYFDKLEQAKAARLAAEHKMHGEFSASLSRQELQ